MAQASYIAGLTPAMRAALAIAPDGRRLVRGLVHGATMSALVRHGLAEWVRESALDPDEWDITLTEVGRAAREQIRARAEERVAPHGFTRAVFAGSQLYNNPDEGGTCTLAGAMRRTGIRW